VFPASGDKQIVWPQTRVLPKQTNKQTNKQTITNLKKEEEKNNVADMDI
jgi:hypothetical protein